MCLLREEEEEEEVQMLHAFFGFITEEYEQHCKYAGTLIPVQPCSASTSCFNPDRSAFGSRCPVQWCAAQGVHCGGVLQRPRACYVESGLCHCLGQSSTGVAAA